MAIHDSDIKRAARLLQADDPTLTYTAARARVLAALATATPAPPRNETAAAPAPSTPSADTNPYLWWQVACVSASHIQPYEFARLTAAPADHDGLFRSAPDAPELGGTLSVFVRVPDDLTDPDLADAIAADWPTLAPVLTWASTNGAAWVYLDVDADPIPGLPNHSVSGERMCGYCHDLVHRVKHTDGGAAWVDRTDGDGCDNPTGTHDVFDPADGYDPGACADYVADPGVDDPDVCARCYHAREDHHSRGEHRPSQGSGDAVTSGAGLSAVSGDGMVNLPALRPFGLRTGLLALRAG